MSNEDLTKYYPSDDFDHFTFLQVMESGDLKDDAYILNAFAIDIQGRTMGAQIVLSVIDGAPHLKDKRVQFANINVYVDDLDYIFDHESPDTDLDLYPQKSDNYDGFVAYKIQAGEGLTAASKIVDPSPPAPSH